MEVSAQSHILATLPQVKYAQVPNE
jgi:hypothetical protein